MIHTINDQYYRVNIAKELGIIVLALLAGIGLIGLMQNKIAASVAIGANEREADRQSSLLLDRYDHLRRELAATRDVKHATENALLPTEDIHALTSALTQLATKNSATLGFTASAPTIEAQTGDLHLYSIVTTLQVTGTKDAVRKFIVDVEHLPYFYSITRFAEQSSVEKGTVTTVLNAKLWTKPTQALTETPNP